jgi:hypothetical membrane protein
VTSTPLLSQHVGASTGSHALQRSLLIAGILSSILYVVIDQGSATLYPGYSILHQAISELSAIGAPRSSARLWSILGPLYGVLFVSFAIGVLRAGRVNDQLRTTGWLLLTFVVWQLLWPFFPMHQRGAERSMTDVAHLVIGAGCNVLILSFMAFGAVSLGPRFRAFSVTLWVVELATAVGTFMYVPIMDSGSTPWLGVVERTMIYVFLAWIACLAAALLRADPPSRAFAD